MIYVWICNYVLLIKPKWLENISQVEYYGHERGS